MPVMRGMFQSANDVDVVEAELAEGVDAILGLDELEGGQVGLQSVHDHAAHDAWSSMTGSESRDTSRHGTIGRDQENHGAGTVQGFEPAGRNTTRASWSVQGGDGRAPRVLQSSGHGCYRLRVVWGISEVP